MNLLKKVFIKCNGLSFPQDFLCLANETYEQTLNLYLVDGRKVLKNITHLHAFVGYCPVVFALPLLSEISSPVIETVFSMERLSEGEDYLSKQMVASLHFINLSKQKTPEGYVCYYEAISGKHRFTSFYHQGIGQLYNRLYNRKPGNVFLKGNRYKQVQIAYSIPRKICLITVGKNGLYNLFPTDLHGQVTRDYYIISLRQAGKACEQVIEAKKIVLSDMNVMAYRQVYNFGKNHMQPLKAATCFAFCTAASALFHLPLPDGWNRYKELILEDIYCAGIHNLLLFRVVSEESRESQPQTLVHLHNVYASWRQKNGLPGNYLLR
jgi:hypothetical protein